MNSRDPTIEKLLLQNEMLNYRLEKAHQKYQQTIENIAAENSKLRNEVKLLISSFFPESQKFEILTTRTFPFRQNWTNF